MVMTRRQLMRVIDTEAIEDAITRTETGTSGEIRVCVAPYFWGRVRKTAERAFDRLGMTKTRDRNGVLFFIVPSRRRFVILGDEGIHARVGQGFWDELSSILSPAFHDGRYGKRQPDRSIPAAPARGDGSCSLLPTVEWG